MPSDICQNINSLLKAAPETEQFSFKVWLQYYPYLKRLPAGKKKINPLLIFLKRPLFAISSQPKKFF